MLVVDRRRDATLLDDLRADRALHAAGDDVKLMVEQLTDPLMHIIRNAVDHGLESAPSPGEPSKSGSLYLRTKLDHSEFVIEIEDSGRGVNWEKVRQLAIQRGLPAKTASDLEQALFADGLSTKANVDETSGRGVGMAAVAAAVRGRGGSIRVRSDGRSGTRIQLSWPASMAHPRLNKRSINPSAKV